MFYGNLHIKDKGGTMWVMSQALIDEAKKLAKVMPDDGEEIKALNFGERKNSVFMTPNEKLITVTNHFKMEGKVFYIGWGLKKN